MEVNSFMHTAESFKNWVEVSENSFLSQKELEVIIDKLNTSKISIYSKID
jgi:hypothetical protein